MTSHGLQQERFNELAEYLTGQQFPLVQKSHTGAGKGIHEALKQFFP